MIVDTNLYAAQQGELDFSYKSAFNKYEVNEGKMKRYSKRRNRAKEIENLTKFNFGKYLIFC